MTSEPLSLKLSSNFLGISAVGPVMYNCTATDRKGGTFSKAGARVFAIQRIWSSGGC